MILKGAVEQVALAGRELGSGPAIVVGRFPDVVQELEGYGFRDYDALQAVALGVILGSFAAGHPGTRPRIQQIHEEWQVNPGHEVDPRTELMI